MSDDLGTMVVSFAADMGNLTDSGEALQEQFGEIATSAERTSSVMSESFTLSEESAIQLKEVFIDLSNQLYDLTSVAQEISTGISDGFASLAENVQKDTTSVEENLNQVAEEATNTSERTKEGFSEAGGGVMSFSDSITMAIFKLQNFYSVASGIGQQLYNTFITPNASMEQTTVAFETLLGKGKKTQDFLQQMKDFAAATPFEFPQVATAAQHFLAFGFAAKDVIPTLTNIGDAMGALGKGAGDVDHLVEIFGQMHAAGKLNAGDMLQISSMGIPAWQFLADAMHKTIPEVQKLSSQGLIPADKAIQAINEGMHKTFGGGMNAQAQTFNGLMSTLQDNVNAAMRAFSGPLFDMAKSGLMELGNIVSSKQFQDFATTMGKDVAGALSRVGTIFQSMFGNVDFDGVLHDISSAFQSLAPPVQQVSKAVAPLMDTFDRGTAILHHTATAAQPLMDTFDRGTAILSSAHNTAVPLMDTFDRGTAILHRTVDAAHPLMDTFDRGTAILSSTHNTAVPLMDTFDRGSAILHRTATSVQQVTHAVDPFASIIKTLTGDLKDVNTVLSSIDWVGDLQDAIDIVGSLGDNFFQLTSNILDSVTQSGLLQDIFSTVNTLFDEGDIVVKAISGDIKDFASGIIDAATKSGAIQSVLKTIRDLLPTVGTFLTNTGNDLKQNLLPPLESLITNVGKTVKNFSDWLDKSGILKTAINDLGPVVHGTSVFVGGLVQGVSDLLGFLNQDTPAATALKDALLAVGGAIVVMKIKDFVGNIFDMVNNIKDAATKFLDFAGDIKGKVADALHSLSVNNLQEVQNSLEETGKTSHTAATSIEQDYTQVGFYADEAAAQVETIGPAAETSAGEVGAASATMEADLKTVGVSADEASLEVEKVGPAALAAEGEANTAMEGVESKAAVAQGTIGGLTNMLGGMLNLINVGESTSAGQRKMTPDQIKQWQQQHPGVPVPSQFVGFASGGFTPGGPIVVGENGPEILVPPKGSAIIPNSVFSGGSPALSVASGDGGTVHIHNHLYIDGHELASVMLNPLGEAMAGKIRTYGPVSGAA